MFSTFIGRRATALATSLAVVVGLAITPAFTATAAEGDEPGIASQTTEVLAEASPPADLPSPQPPVEEAVAPPAPVEELPGEEVPAEELPVEEVPVGQTPELSDASTPPAPQSMMRSNAPSETASVMGIGSTGISPAAIGPFVVDEGVSVQFTNDRPSRNWSLGLLDSFVHPDLHMSSEGALTGHFDSPGVTTLTVSTWYPFLGVIWLPVSKQISVTVKPEITTDALPETTVGETYSQEVRSSNQLQGVTFSYDASLLPPGLSFTKRGILLKYLELSGQVLAVPQNVTRYEFWVTSTVNGVTSDPRWFSITVGNAAPTWGTVTLPDATVGVPYPDTQVAADGEVTLTYSGTGLPAGLEISSSGVITGTPTGDLSYASVQTVPVTFTADNGTTSSTVVNLTVKSPPSVTTTALPDAWVTRYYNAAIATSGPQAALTATELPAGLTLIGDTTDGYAIDGTPTAAGDFTIELTATNAAGSREFSVTVTVNTAPAFSTATSLPNAITGTAYTADIDAAGKSVTFTLVSGPAGMVIDSATGVLSGWMPSDEVNVTARVRAENLSGSMEKNFTIRPFAVPAMAVMPLDHGVLGSPYSDEIDFTGRNANVKKTSGSLPPGLTLERDGELHGVPTAAGDYTFAVRAKNFAGATVQSFTVSVTVPVMQVSTSSILRGGSLTVSGSGYVPGDDLEFWLHSTPVLLGTVTSADGTFTKSVMIPANTPAGAHHLVVTGAQSGTQSVPLTITAPPAPPAAPQQPRATTQSQSPLTVTPGDETTVADEYDDAEVEENEAEENLPTLNTPKADGETVAATPVDWTGLLVAALALLLAALALWFILWRRRRTTES